MKDSFQRLGLPSWHRLNVSQVTSLDCRELISKRSHRFGNVHLTKPIPGKLLYGKCALHPVMGKLLFVGLAPCSSAARHEPTGTKNPAEAGRLWLSADLRTSATC
jgi:hypothetical protein